MFETPLVSIVVPVYNAVLYLKTCIESLARQDEKNIDIILVNDGSADGSLEICKELELADSRIKVLSQKNMGATAARKNGVAIAKGDWICFVDAGDELPLYSISLLLHGSMGNCIVIGYVNYTDIWEYRKYDVQLNQKKYLQWLLTHKIHGGPVARLINRFLFDENVFDIPREIVYGEDFIMNIRLGFKCNRVQLISDTVYNYIARPSSAVRKNPFLKMSYTRSFERILYSSILNKKGLIVSIIRNYLARKIMIFKKRIKLCF